MEGKDMLRVSIKQIRYFVVCAVIILLPFMSYVRIGGMTVNLSYADYVLPFALVLTYAKPLRIGDRKIRCYIGHLKLLLLIMALSAVNLLKWTDIGGAFKAYVVAVMKFVICYLYVLLFGRFIAENGNKKQIVDLFVVSSVLNAALAYAGVAMNMAGIRNSFVFENSYRACGSFSDPNLFACFIFIGIYFTLYNFRRNKKPKYLVALFFQIGAVLLSASKAGFISLAVYLMFVMYEYLVSSKRYMKKSTFTIGVVIVVLGIVVLFKTGIFEKSLGRIGGLLTSDSGDITTGRFGLWGRAFDLLKHNFFLGVGYGMHNVASSQLIGTASDYIFHNTYLNYLVELGMAGVVWLFCSLRYLLKCQMAMVKRSRCHQLMGVLLAVLLMAFTLNLENFRNLWVFLCYVVYLTAESVGER